MLLFFSSAKVQDNDIATEKCFPIALHMAGFILQLPSVMALLNGFAWEKSDNKGLDLQAVVLQLNTLVLTFPARRKLCTALQLSRAQELCNGLGWKAS